MNDTKSQVRIVNVAQVPKRSPFRYPGGKTWLVPYLRAWLRSIRRPELFVEPFVGGGIISLTVGFENLADRVEMVELDADVAAVWKTILKEADWLSKRILSFDITAEAVKAELDKKTRSVKQRAFCTILKNRTFHGGILAAGSAPIKNGENGKGIKSRWYADTLSNRILAIGERRDRFSFYQTDGLGFMEKKLSNRNAAFFIDPPYTAGGNGKRAGRRLYNCCDLDHARLFDLAKRIEGDFLMTYDNDPEVVEMAKARGFDTEIVPMKNTHHAEMVELLIGNDLNWARRMLYPKTLF